MDQYEAPEQHNWGPRDYFKGDFYKHSSAHFISEAGYHVCPSKASLARFISPEKLWPCRDDEWDTHDTDYIAAGRRGYSRIGLMVDQVKTLFGSESEAMEDFILASQISQAEAKKYFIERVRAHRYDISGLIWWNLIDLRVEDGESGELLLERRGLLVPPNAGVIAGGIRSIPGAQRLYIMRWRLGAEENSNHFVSGYPPFELERYKVWAALDRGLEISLLCPGLRGGEVAMGVRDRIRRNT